MAAVITALKDSTQVKGKPTLILANVVPGKGVSFVENDYVWHGKPPSQDELAKGLAELTALREQLCQ